MGERWQGLGAALRAEQLVEQRVPRCPHCRSVTEPPDDALFVDGAALTVTCMHCALRFTATINVVFRFTTTEPDT